TGSCLAAFSALCTAQSVFRALRGQSCGQSSRRFSSSHCQFHGIPEFSIHFSTVGGQIWLSSPGTSCPAHLSRCWRGLVSRFHPAAYRCRFCYTSNSRRTLLLGIDE